MRSIVLLLCLLFSPQQVQPQDSPKLCAVTEVVTEGVRSDCGSWRPAKAEKLVMPTDVSKRLRVGDQFYFVWKETRWVAEIREPERTVALIFENQIVILTISEAEEEYERLSNIRNRTEQQEKGHAALVLALGTISGHEPVPTLNSRERLDWEIRRGVRKPLQKPDRGGN